MTRLTRLLALAAAGAARTRLVSTPPPTDVSRRIGRQVGINARLWMLPRLMRRTKADFKGRVFGLLKSALAGEAVDDKEDLS